MTRRFNISFIKKLATVFIMVGIILIPIYSNAAGVTMQNHNVSYSGGTKSISVVWADLNDSRVRVETVLAKGAVGETDTLANIVNSITNSDGKAVAGINGSFFQAYTDCQPVGTLVSVGEIKHISNTGSMFIIDADRKARVDSLYIGIQGGLNNQWEWPNNWYAWNINHFYNSSEAVMVFDSNYKGPRPSHNFTSIKVDNGKVTSIGKGSFEIPQNGFLLLTNDQEMIDKFKIGTPAEFKYCVYENDYISKPHTGQEVDFSGVRAATSAGPTLVKNGVIVANPALEGFTEEKILNNKARRSFIGVTSDGRIGFSSVDGVNVKELAEIAKNLEMKDAINLDGGASSGMVYKGNNVVKEGRLLSNAIVIKYLENNPISVNLNKSPIIFDTDPFVDSASNRTFVPLRGIAESLGAKVGWDQSTSSVLIDRPGTNLRLKVGSPDVYINGKRNVMDAPVVLRNSRTYVPVRFVTEFFGGDVAWDGNTKTVELKISRVTDKMDDAEKRFEIGKYNKSIPLFEEVIEKDPSNLVALKRLANIYGVHNVDYEKAINYYEKITLIDSNDSGVLHSLGWVYYNEKNMDDAIATFKKYIDLEPYSPAGYYGLGQCHESYLIQDKNSAKKYYEVAIEKGLSGESLEYAKKYLVR